MTRGRFLLSAAAVGAGAALLRRRTGPPGPVRPAEGPVPRVTWLARKMDPYREVPVGEMVVPPLPPAEVVSVPGRGELFVRRAGDGPGVPVLLLHGWMASADMNWFRLFDSLGSRHPVIALDHRGHGRGIRSPARFTLEDCADDAAALLGHLGVERAVVVGYSMGGPIATLVWRRHPDLVAGLVLEATALNWWDTRLERARWWFMGPVSVLLRWPAGRMLLVRLLGEGGAVPSELLQYRAWAEGEFRRADPTDLADAGRALGRFDARPYAAQIDVPASVVVTTADHLVQAEKQRQMARAIGARVFEFDGDHGAAVLQSEEFAAVTMAAVDHVLGHVEPVPVESPTA